MILQVTIKKVLQKLQIIQTVKSKIRAAVLYSIGSTDGSGYLFLAEQIEFVTRSDKELIEDKFSYPIGSELSYYDRFERHKIVQENRLLFILPAITFSIAVLIIGESSLAHFYLMLSFFSYSLRLYSYTRYLPSALSSGFKTIGHINCLVGLGYTLEVIVDLIEIEFF